VPQKHKQLRKKDRSGVAIDRRRGCKKEEWETIRGQKVKGGAPKKNNEQRKKRKSGEQGDGGKEGKPGMEGGLKEGGE